MRITLERSVFLKSLNHVQSVVERRNTIPILANILLIAEKNRLSLTATDLDIEIVEAVNADVVRAGAITAPAHTLYEIVRKLPDGAQVQLEHTSGDTRLTLSAGRSRFQLSCLPRDDFPVMPAGALPHNFALQPKEFAAIIDKTRFAVSTEETRYYLNGIYFHAAVEKQQPVLRGVATDGHRLARYDIEAPKGATELPGVIVPRKTINEIRKLLDDASGAVEVAVSDSKIRVALGHVVVTSKLIDGTFPDYQRVIPAGNDKILELGRQDFLEAVDRVSTVSTEKSRAVKLNLERDKLTLTVVSPEAGSATEELFVEYRGEPLEIGFNSRYLLDILERVEGPTVRMLLADSGAPTLVRDAAAEASLFVLMPMRV
ncbi:MAG TPA: DNA polymerase III subunit beta [Alphaproteobacteria bacterium]|nr:DNA polymerase III subunit beta [Alphaproteobacteria bacterium]HAJ48335.1 DNA polymerase III subunit beta [Alphaproteobacteria bacterium]